MPLLRSRMMLDLLNADDKPTTNAANDNDDDDDDDLEVIE